MHGDDFVVVGMPKELQWMRGKIEEKYELIVKILGPDAEQSKEVRVLNRILRWTDQGIEYEADPRHAEAIINELKLEEAKAVSTPAEKNPPVCPDDDIELDLTQHRLYRRVVAKANYLGADRMDIQHTVQGLSRFMDKPDRKHMRAMKRLGRY